VDEGNWDNKKVVSR